MPSGDAGPGERTLAQRTWFLRSEHCYLVPGDSPMGYRLPLDSLPWAKTTDYPYVHPPDPTAPLPLRALPNSAFRSPEGSLSTGQLRAKAVPRVPVGRGTTFDLAPSLFESASWINRSAICAEPRNGILYIFMPPVESLEDYLGLVAAMEATAEAMRQAIV